MDALRRKMQEEAKRFAKGKPTKSPAGGSGSEKTPLAIQETSHEPLFLPGQGPVFESLGVADSGVGPSVVEYRTVPLGASFRPSEGLRPARSASPGAATVSPAGGPRPSEAPKTVGPVPQVIPVASPAVNPRPSAASESPTVGGDRRSRPPSKRKTGASPATERGAKKLKSKAVIPSPRPSIVSDIFPRDCATPSWDMEELADLPTDFLPSGVLSALGKSCPEAFAEALPSSSFKEAFGFLVQGAARVFYGSCEAFGRYDRLASRHSEALKELRRLRGDSSGKGGSSSGSKELEERLEAEVQRSKALELELEKVRSESSAVGEELELERKKSSEALELEREKTSECLGKISRLEQELEEERLALTTAKSNAQVLVKHCTAIDSDRVRLSNSLSYAKAARDALEGDLKEVREELASSKAELQRSCEKLEVLEVELGKIRPALDRSEAELKETRAKLESAEDALMKSEQSLKSRVTEGIDAYKTEMEPVLHYNRILSKRAVLNQVEAGEPPAEIREKLAEDAEASGLPREMAFVLVEETDVPPSPNPDPQLATAGSAQKTPERSPAASSIVP